MWLEQDKSEEMVTPRYLSDSTWLMRVPSMQTDNLVFMNFDAETRLCLKSVRQKFTIGAIGGQISYDNQGQHGPSVRINLLLFKTHE